MKLFAAAAIVLLSLASSLSYAEQNTTPVRQNQRDTMIIPSEHNDSPFDFNHMAAGNDKSDELGVPYYQQTTCDAITRIIVYSPVSGAFFIRAPCQAAPNVSQRH